MIAFWLIVLVGVSLTGYAIVSPRRNPPMRKCFACKGDGITWRPTEFPVGDYFTCVGCDGAGWVEVARTKATIHDVPCRPCVAGYDRPHACEAPRYCACDRGHLHAVEVTSS